MSNILFSKEEIDTIERLINIHLSLPMKYELTGSNFETLFSIAIDGQRERRKLLFDVMKGTTGWSLKTLQSSSDKFELVLKRCNIIGRDVPWQVDDAQLLGNAIVDNVNAFYSDSISKQGVVDRRLCILLYDKQASRFKIFQSSLDVYEKKDIEWRFSKHDKNGNLKKDIKSLMGYHNGKLVYRWYRSGTQLFGVYDVPANAQVFNLSVKSISFESLSRLFKASPAVNEQSTLLPEELLNSQLDDTENGSSQ